MLELTAEAMLEVVRDEVRDLGGRVSDHVTDGRRLFVRSLLPDTREIVTGDKVGSGVALRYSSDEVEVRPYVFREVCRNGAIIAHSGRGCLVRAWGDAMSCTLEVRQAIGDAASREVFEDFVASMRSSRGLPATDWAISFLSSAPDLDPSTLLNMLERFSNEGRLDTFALGNAVTSLARDTADPELRWQRECLGAAVFARLGRRSRAGARQVRV